MKKLNKCVVENCIPTPSSCVEWNGGDIEFLGICNGEPLNNLIWEIINKLQDIVGEDLSQFDIDSLLTLCNQKAPNEVSLLTILTLLRDNQICLKDYVDKLQDTLNELFKEESVDVNLKCFQQLDNIGNTLNINRAGLDQLVIDQLCNHKASLEELASKYTLLKNTIDNLDIPDTTEPSVKTCIDNEVKPISSQLISVAKAHCDLESATGGVVEIATALSRTPSDWKTIIGNPIDWNNDSSNLANNYNNLLLVVNNLVSRVKFMEENCCAVTCDDIQLGFSVMFSEDGTALLLTFSNATGTKIPSGFVDKGSKGTITDSVGNTQPFNLTITNSYQAEIPILGLVGELKININAKIGNATLICDKCLNKTVALSSCGVCEITATGSDGAVAVIVYEDNI